MSEDEELKNYADALQEQIMQQMRNVYSEAVIERWQNPRNVGKIDNPDGYGKVKGECGDTMEVFLKIEKNKISECTFMTDGCGTSMAAGSMATEIAKDKTFTEALAKVSAEEILKQLGGLPPDSVHCAQLASETLRRALADYLHNRNSSWKKAYRKI